VTAARAVGAGKDDLDWLTPLRASRQRPALGRAAAVQAEAEHLRTRPHDHDGADLVAELAAHDAAVEHLSIAYMDLLDWSVGLAHDRRSNAQHRLGRRFRRARTQPAEPAQCEVPQRVLDGLTLRADRPGWHDRRAA
jgi:hypothetical protein